MPLRLPAQHPSLIIRKEAFERVSLSRTAIDERLGLTDEEFRVEGGLVVIGPIVADAELQSLIADLEDAGLVHFEDFFDLSGNWPEWLRLFAQG
ncbi:MAG: hypothetical protein H7066_18725 [Cytophagaceae bacterium]|nr:hypothetical protein [Gemmatimonadaceae bacterium]